MRAASIALLALAAAVAPAASSPSPVAPYFNTSMLRSQLPPDAPELIVPEVAPVAGPYDPAAAKNFVYRAAASYCDKASIQSWCACGG